MWGTGPRGTIREGLIWNIWSVSWSFLLRHLTHVRVGPIVVSLYVFKVGGGLKSVLLPVQPTHPAGNYSEQVSKEGRPSKSNLQMDVRITVANGPNVALKMANINRVESYLISNRSAHCALGPMGTYDSYEEPDISLSQAVANEIGLSL